MQHRFELSLDDHELADLRRAAERDGVSPELWARRVLAGAAAEARSERQRAALQAAAARSGPPSGDIDEILRDIERGRR
ncbi:MAG: hypothetical protein KF709_11130 [Gemmatimonadaceae bacterium]|nr:hypothetical protein [Gemmatimonadaceae bacterium]